MPLLILQTPFLIQRPTALGPRFDSGWKYRGRQHTSVPTELLQLCFMENTSIGQNDLEYQQKYNK